MTADDMQRKMDESHRALIEEYRLAVERWDHCHCPYCGAPIDEDGEYEARP